MNRDQIKEHVQKYGSKKVNITERLIYKWWKIFNREVFGGRLPDRPDKLDLRDIYCLPLSRKKDKDGNRIREKEILYGYCLFDDKSKSPIILGINPVHIYSRQMFLAVLVHEMTHAFHDMTKMSRSAHGKAFFEFKDAIEQLGLPLEKQYDIHDFDKFSIYEEIHDL